MSLVLFPFWQNCLERRSEKGFGYPIWFKFLHASQETGFRLQANATGMPFRELFNLRLIFNLASPRNFAITFVGNQKAEYRLKTEQLIKANSKEHPKLLCQLLNTTSFNKSNILTV